MKLYATLETSRGKTVSISDNEQITATVYDGNMKAYSVTIALIDVGNKKGVSIVNTQEWRNENEERRKLKSKKQTGEQMSEGESQNILYGNR